VSVEGQHGGSLLHLPPHYRGSSFRARRIYMLPHGLDAVREPNDFELDHFQVMDSTTPVPTVFLAPRITTSDLSTAHVLVAHADVPMTSRDFMSLLYRSFPGESGLVNIRVKVEGEMFLEFTSPDAALASMDTMSPSFSLDVCRAPRGR
jgi:hypothetical protein